MKNVTFQEFDTDDEKLSVINRVIDNLNLVEGKVLQLVAAKTAKKPSGKTKKGFINMKTLLMVCVMAIALVFGSNALAYVATDINYEIASNPQSLSDYLEDSIASGTFTFTPIAAPAGNDIIEGKIYYDITANTWYGSNDGSTWTAFDTGSAVSLDGAYNVGIAITVDAGAVAMTATNAADNVVLALAQSDTGTTKGMTITNAGTGNTIDIQGQGSSKDIEGTDDSWNVSSAGALTMVTAGFTGDITVTGTAADIVFDVSDDELLIEDDAVLSFGDDADLTVSWDATNLVIEQLTQDAGVVTVGATNSFDWLFYDNAATGTATFNSGEATLSFNAYDIQLQDGDFIAFGDGDDWTATSATAKKLLWTPATGDGSDSFDIGANTAGADFQLFGADTSGASALFDSDADLLTFNAIDITVQDGDFINFGDSKDFTMTATNKVFTWQDLQTDESSAINVGADQDGIDVKVFGATTGSFALWDASGDALWFDKADIAFSETDGLLFGDALGTGDWRIDSTSAVLLFAQVAADTGTIEYGVDGTGYDVTWYGEDASASMKWEGNGANNNTLNITGVDSADTIFKLVGANTTTDSDTMTITHAGDGDAIQMTLSEPAGVGINIVGDAAGTAPQINIDLETGAWVGAATTGAIEVTNDGLLVADASLLRLENKGQIAVANDGACLEVIDSGAARATSYAVRIASTSNEALHVDAGLVVIDEYLTVGTGVQSGSIARTANAAFEGGTSVIPSGASYVTVTSAGANNICSLPVAVVGNIITVFVGANGFEMQTPDLNAPTINQVDCSGGDTNEAAIPANTISVFTCYTANAWTLVNYTYAGAFTAAIVPDGV